MRLPDDLVLDDVNGIVNDNAGSKEIKARATFRKSLPVFTASTITDSLNQTDPAWIDSCSYLTGVLRVANVGNVLYTQYISDIHGAIPAWTNTGIALKAGSRPAVDQGYVYYQQPDTQVMYRPYWDWSQYIWVANVSGPVHLAPIGLRCYGLWQRNAGAWEILALNGQVSSQYTIFGPTTMPRLDAVAFNGYEYLYSMDRDEGRIIEIKHSGNANSGKDSYGVAKSVIPIDAIDVNYGFKLGYANVVDSRVVVTGMMTRTSDDTAVQFDAYSIGPEYFSFGREMFIASGAPVGGKMLRVGNEFVVMGAGKMFIALATGVFGGATHPSLELQTSDFASFRLMESESRSATVDLDMSTALSHTALNTGSDVDLELGYTVEETDYWTQLGRYHVQADVTNQDEQGQSRQVSGIGKSAKRLAMWSPEQGVYVPSQAKVFDYPSTMTKVVRATGLWESANPNDPQAAIQLKELNKLGVLYSVGRASRGGAMRAKFYYASDSYFKPYYGVVVNYYRETAAEAVARLGVEVTDLEDDMYGHNGIVAIYSKTEHNGAEGIALYLWKDSVLTKLTSVSYTIAAATWHWLQIEFIEGEIRVKYKTASGTIWSEVIVFAYNNASLPWKSDTLGRGAVVVKNIVPETTCYPLGVDDTTLGVESNTAFPTSGTVLVDGEQMTYSAKSTATPPANWGAGIAGPPGWPTSPKILWPTNGAYSCQAAGGYSGIPLALSQYTNSYYRDDLDYPVFSGVASHSFIGLALVTMSAASPFNQTKVVPFYSGGRTFRVTDFRNAYPSTWTTFGLQYPPGWEAHIGDTNYGPGTYGMLQIGYTIYTDVDLRTLGGWGTNPYEDVDHNVYHLPFVLKPALHISARGANGTTATTHSISTAQYYTTKRVQVELVGSFSQDEDQTMEDALKTVTNLAGGTFGCKTLKSGGYTFTAGSGQFLYNDHRNFIAKFDGPALSDGYGFGMVFRAQTTLTAISGFPYPGATSGYYLELQRTGGAYYLDLYTLAPTNSKTLIERVPVRPTNLNGAATANVPSGEFKLSVQDDLFSVWLNGRYLHTFRDVTYPDGTGLAFWSRQAGVMSCYLSELDELLADIVVGVRGNGMSVIAELIADRGINWRDDQSGGLYFYKTRTHQGDMLDIIAASSSTKTDDYISRVRAEGLLVSEILSTDYIPTVGNAFATINARYANTVEESRMAADGAVKESIRNSQSQRYAIVVHPAIQPGDAYDFFTPSGTQSLIIRSQSMAVGFFGNNFVADMQCELIPENIG